MLKEFNVELDVKFLKPEDAGEEEEEGGREEVADRKNGELDKSSRDGNLELSNTV